MLKRLASIVLAVSCFTGGAFGQEPKRAERDVVALPGSVWFTHYDCPPVDPAAQGATADNPMELEFFSRAWANAAYTDELYEPEYDPEGHNAPNRYECRWIRISGFMNWLDYYDYRGVLLESAFAAYQEGAVRYIIENIAPGAPPRSDLSRRRITVVGRFYNLCAAAERAMKEDGQEGWRLFGPCHYGSDQGMMLADARIEKIHDAAPQYLVGEANRAVMGSLVIATAAQHRETAPVVRAWADTLGKGLAPYIDALLARYPASDDEHKQEIRQSIRSADSYASYLLMQKRFNDLKVQSAPIQVFRIIDRDSDDGAFDRAIGCICLEKSCTDRWPLTEDDASNFLGPAACVSLDRDRKTSVWKWN